MKSKKILALIILTLFSCKNEELSNSYILFDAPQPSNVAPITSFPEKYIGTFGTQSKQLKIDLKHIINIDINFYDKTKSEMDSVTGFELKNNKVYDKETHQVYITTIKDNNIHWEVAFADTVFSFNKNETAKLYKSSIVLNKKHNDGYQVSMINFGFNEVTYIQLGTKTDYLKLKAEMKIPSQKIDSSNVILSPSRADFRKLLRIKGFEYEKTYNQQP